MLNRKYPNITNQLLKPETEWQADIAEDAEQIR